MHIALIQVSFMSGSLAIFWYLVIISWQCQVARTVAPLLKKVGTWPGVLVIMAWPRTKWSTSWLRNMTLLGLLHDGARWKGGGSSSCVIVVMLDGFMVGDGRVVTLLVGSSGTQILSVWVSSMSLTCWKMLSSLAVYTLINFCTLFKMQLWYGCICYQWSYHPPISWGTFPCLICSTADWFVYATGGKTW